MIKTDLLLKRHSGLELMRIVTMLMVLVLHYNYNCGFLKVTEVRSVIPQLSESLCIIAVDCFVLLTGYFSYRSGFKIKKLLTLWLEVFFYSVVLYLFDILVNGRGIELDRVLSTLFPLSTGKFWFISDYFVLLLFAPFLNRLITILSGKEHLALILTGVFVFSVVLCIFSNSNALKFDRNYDFVWFIVLYFTGAYLNKYPPEIKKERALAVYFAASVMTFASKYAFGFLSRFKLSNVVLSLLFGGNGKPFETYSSILSFTAAVSLFVFFSKLEIENTGLRRVINFTASLVLTCYLLLGEWTWNLVSPQNRESVLPTLLYSVGMILLIFTVCCIIELLRQLLFILPDRLFKPDRLCAKIENKLNCVIDGLSGEKSK